MIPADAPEIQEGAAAFYAGKPITASPYRDRGIIGPKTRRMLLWRAASQAATLTDLLTTAK